MGNRANFVIIRNEAATAHYDQWAALGSTYGFMAGPDIAAEEAERYTQEDSLMDWAFAEAGFLIDFDQKVAIVFGYPEMMDAFDDDATDDPREPEPRNDVERAIAALDDDPRQFLALIAPEWKGWKLIWDDRGVDAFALYLASRDIASVKTAAPSHPPDTRGPVVFDVQS